MSKRAMRRKARLLRRLRKRQKNAILFQKIEGPLVLPKVVFRRMLSNAETPKAAQARREE